MEEHQQDEFLKGDTLIIQIFFIYIKPKRNSNQTSNYFIYIVIFFFTETYLVNSS